MAHERALPGAILTRYGDAVARPNQEPGVLQAAGRAERQAPCAQPDDGVAIGRATAEPDPKIARERSRQGRFAFSSLPGPTFQLPEILPRAVVPIASCSRFLTRIVIARVDAAQRLRSFRPLGVDTPLLHLAFEPAAGLVDPLPLVTRGPLLSAEGFHGPRIPAGAQLDTRRRDEERMSTEPVQEIPLVADKEADPPIHSQRAQDALSSIPIEVVRWLVYGEQVRAKPQARRNLDPLALPMGEGVPAAEPIPPDPEDAAHPMGLSAIGGKEVRRPRHGCVGSLGTVQPRLRRADRSPAWLQLLAREAKERRLSGSVLTDDACPSLAEPKLDPAEEPIG